MTTIPSSLPVSRFWTDAPVLAMAALAVAATALPVLVAHGLDARRVMDEPVWLKPLKFHIALVIYLATLAFYARFMPEAARMGRGWQVFSVIVAASVVLELVWIDGAAMLGVRSHFNHSGLWAVVYPVMGVVAITLTAASLWMGLAIRGNDMLDPALRLSLVLGLVLTFVLTVGAAGFLAGGTGHLVGTPVTGAKVPLMGWSREVGDLRIAHFIAAHALHALPLLGWALAVLGLGGTAFGLVAVWGAAVLYVAVVVATLAQALAGMPLI